MDLTSELDEIVNRYPTPIAEEARKLGDVRAGPTETQGTLFRLAEATVRYLSLVAWSEYRLSGNQSVPIEAVLQKSAGRPSFGDRLQLLRMLDSAQRSSVMRPGVADKVLPEALPAGADFRRAWDKLKETLPYGLPGNIRGFLQAGRGGPAGKLGLLDVWGLVIECRNASEHHALKCAGTVVAYPDDRELVATVNEYLIAAVVEALRHGAVRAVLSDYAWARPEGVVERLRGGDLRVSVHLQVRSASFARKIAWPGHLEPRDYLVRLSDLAPYVPFDWEPGWPPAWEGAEGFSAPSTATIVTEKTTDPATAARAQFEDTARDAAEDGVISADERRMLDKIRARLGLTAADAEAIIDSVLPRIAKPENDEPMRPLPGAPSPIGSLSPITAAPEALPHASPTPQRPPTRERRTWDETSYFADMAKRADSAAKLDLHRRVYEAACSIADGRTWVVGWGTGKNQGSFTLKCPDASILSAYSGGTLSLNLGAWGKLSAATSADLVRAFVEGLGFAPTDAICDGGTQFPNITAGLLRHDPDGARLPRWLRRAQSLIAGEAAAPATATAPTPTGPLPARCAAALRLIRDAGIVAFTPHEVSNDRSLFKVGLDAGGLWFQTEPQHSVFVWFHSAADGLLAAVGWYHSTESGDARWLAIRDRLEALGPELWPGWHFQRPDWKPGGGYEAYSRVGDGESADALAARLCRVVAALSAALVAAGAGTAAAAPEDPVERTAALLGNVPTELGGYLGKFAVQTSREDWSNLTESLGTPPRPFTRKTKSSDKWMDGRVGLDLVSPWRPGVFAGIFLDPTDHKVTPSQPYLGMDFVVILDTQHNQCRVPYDTLPAFGALVRRLTANPGRWNVLDHVGTARKPNRWHPIHLRRPLVEVWEGARNAEERYAAWLGAAREGIDLLLSGGEARDLRAAWAEAGPTRVAEPSAQADTDVDESDSFETLPTRGIQERAESVLLDEAEARGVKSLLVRLRAYVTERCVQVPGLNEVRKVWAFAYACKGATLGYSTGAVTVLHLNVRDHDEPRRLLVSLRDAELRRGNNAAAMNALMSRWAKGPVDGRGYRAITLGTESEVDAFWQDLAALQPFSGG